MLRCAQLGPDRNRADGARTLSMRSYLPDGTYEDWCVDHFG